MEKHPSPAVKPETQKGFKLSGIIKLTLSTPTTLGKAFKTELDNTFIYRSIITKNSFKA